MNVAAIIPVHGRLPLLKYTIGRLLNKNQCDTVICIGETPEERESCESAGAKFIHHVNRPLGGKWNAGFKEAKKYNPDACLFVGSSDWVSDNWLSMLMPLMGRIDMVGTPGCSFLDVSQKGFKVLIWPGYSGDRSNESIGIGRLLSKRILDKMNWLPFSSHMDNSMDHQMNLNVVKNGGSVAMIRDKELVSLSISTDQWINKHKFSDHETGRLKSQKVADVRGFLNTNFPEAYSLYKDLYQA